MVQDYDPETFWDERFEIYGHTGWVDELIYPYDQDLRLKAINKALSHSKILVDENESILDVGCGTGDLVFEFAKKGAAVTGIDVSGKVIKKTKERFIKENKKVKIFKAKIENTKFPPNSFDLVTSITVLQHIVDEKLFLRAIKNIINVVNRGGNILILEYSPYNEKSPKINAPYIAIRTRKEWINVFKNEGCILLNEFGIPQIGIKFLKWCVSPITQKITLKMAYPLDYFLLPFPKKYTDLRIFIFRKIG